MKLKIAALFEVLLMIIPIPASILMNRVLGPVERGVLANLLLIPSIAATLVSCNWDKTLRSYLFANHGDTREILGVTNVYFIVQSILGICASFIYIQANKDLYTDNLLFSIIVVIFAIPIQLSANYILTQLICLNESLVAYKVKIIAGLAFLLFVCFFVLNDSLNIYTALVSNQMVSVSILICSLFFFKGFFRVEASAHALKKYLKNLTHSFPSHAIESISNQLDVLLVIRFAGYAEAGSYIAFKVLELPFKAIFLSVLNVGSSRTNMKYENHLRKFVYYPIFLQIILFVSMLFLLAPIKEVLSFLIGQDYSSMYWILSYLFIAFATANAYEIALNAVLMTGARSEYNGIKLTVSLIKIVTLLFFSNLYQFVGVFIALILSASVGIALSILKLRFTKFAH